MNLKFISKSAMRVLFLAICLAAAAEWVPGLGLTQAHAVIGRPLTPMSYAGVARRSVYRGAAVATAAVATTAVVAGAAVSSAYITTLPGGCMQNIYGGYTYHNCGGVYYQPVYDGPNVVYQQTNPPG